MKEKLTKNKKDGYLMNKFDVKKKKIDEEFFLKYSMLLS